KLLASFIKGYLNMEPPLQAVEGLRKLRVGPHFDDRAQIRLTGNLLKTLHWTFMKETQLDSIQRKEISWDAARKLASLGLQASRIDVSASLCLFAQAINVDYRLLYPSAVVRGLGRAFEQRMWTT